jgi:hypothetical protein
MICCNNLSGYLTHKEGNMTKADLVEKISLMTSFTKKESSEIMERVFDVVNVNTRSWGEHKDRWLRQF